MQQAKNKVLQLSTKVNVCVDVYNKIMIMADAVYLLSVWTTSLIMLSLQRVKTIKLQHSSLSELLKRWHLLII